MKSSAKLKKRESLWSTTQTRRHSTKSYSNPRVSCLGEEGESRTNRTLLGDVVPVLVRSFLRFRKRRSFPRASMYSSLASITSGMVSSILSRGVGCLRSTRREVPPSQEPEVSSTSTRSIAFSH